MDVLRLSSRVNQTLFPHPAALASPCLKFTIVGLTQTYWVSIFAWTSSSQCNLGSAVLPCTFPFRITHCSLNTRYLWQGVHRCSEGGAGARNSPEMFCLTVQVTRALETRLSFMISHIRAEHQCRLFKSRQHQKRFSPFAPDLCPIRVSINFCLHSPQMLTPVGIAGMVRFAEKERVFNRRSQGPSCTSEPGSTSCVTFVRKRPLLLGH